MSFTIICDECGSENVAVDSHWDIAVVTCLDCNQKQCGDQFPYAD